MEQNPAIQNTEELEFAIFCIESVAARLNENPTRLYNALAGPVGILYRYIVPEYEVLHTQDKEYIVDDILGVMQEEGITI